jgi:hypothetical protein
MNIEDLRAAYKLLLNTDDGIEILEDLALRFHVRSPVFSENPYETAFRDGQRSVVLYLQNMIIERPIMDIEQEE